MKVFNQILSAFLFLSCFCSCGFLFSQVDVSKVKIESVKDIILWEGYGCPSEFDSALIKNEIEKEEAFQRGLKLHEDRAKKGSLPDQETLADYYCFEEKVFKKGLFWSLKCAEQGSGMGMDILSWCYTHGKGVVKDTEEGMKWLFLAEAAGNKYAEEVHNKIKKLDGYESLDEIIRGKQKAKEWVKEHPKAFFNPD